MNDLGKSQRRRRNKRVQLGDALERGHAAKTKHPSARARSAAADKAAQTRARRATVLKTLKTGEESYSEKNRTSGDRDS
jgi:hypothetical protein